MCERKIHTYIYIHTYMYKLFVNLNNEFYNPRFILIIFIYENSLISEYICANIVKIAVYIIYRGRKKYILHLSANIIKFLLLHYDNK